MSGEEQRPPPPGRRGHVGPGIDPLEPRTVDRRYTFDAMFERWYSARDEDEMVRIGRGLIARLLSWILASDKFKDEDKEHAKEVKASTDIQFKVQENIHDIGSPDEHYQMKYDHYVKKVRGSEYEVATKSMQREWTNVVLNAQEAAIAELSSMCLEKRLIETDYNVGETPEEGLDRRVHSYEGKGGREGY